MEFLKDIAIYQSLKHYHLLVLVTTLSSLVLIPYLGFAAGTSLVSLWFNRRGRKEHNVVFIQLAHALIDRALFNKSLIIILAILPGLSLVFAYAQILQGTQSLGVSLAGFGFLSLLAGMILLYSYKYTFRVQDILESYRQLLENQTNDQHKKSVGAYQESNTLAHLRSGRYGILFLCASFILYAAAMSVTANPRTWDLDSLFTLFISLDIWLKLTELFFMSIGLFGFGLLYFSFARKNRNEYHEEYVSLVTTLGIRFSVVGFLGLPIALLLNVAVISDEALSGSIYSLVSTAIIFFFLSAHFIYGYYQSPQSATLIIGFILFLFAIGMFVVSDNLALGTAIRSQVAFLANSHNKSIEELKANLGVVTVSFTGADIYQTRCESCHLFDKKKVGPPYYETIPKYRGKKAELVSFILHPTKKNPEYPPMQNPGLKAAEADSVARYIMQRVASSYRGERTNMKLLSTLALRHTSRISDYFMLMKPELTLLSVSTAVCSASIALQGSVHYVFLVHTLLGTTLIGGAAGAMNHYIERRYDAMMKRTEHRPLPAGRVRSTEALLFGVVLGLAGLSYLAIFTNWVAVSFSVLTLVSYLVIYTPLKRKTPFASIVGGIPGALPPLIGWSIVQGSVPIEAWSLFFILFFWQMPHFLSLAWMYRNDYARANYRLLTVMDTTGAATSRQILVYSIALIPASLMPMVVGLTGMLYFFTIVILSVGFLIVAIHFYRVRTNAAARQLFYSSLFFLPLLFFLMMFL